MSQRLFRRFVVSSWCRRSGAAAALRAAWEQLQFAQGIGFDSLHLQFLLIQLFVEASEWLHISLPVSERES